MDIYSFDLPGIVSKPISVSLEETDRLRMFEAYIQQQGFCKKKSDQSLSDFDEYAYDGVALDLYGCQQRCDDLSTCTAFQIAANIADLNTYGICKIFKNEYQMAVIDANDPTSNDHYCIIKNCSNEIITFVDPNDWPYLESF